MNKKRIFLITIIISLFIPVKVFADVGDMGFFGGISEGRKLPKTTELLLDDGKKKKSSSDTFVYSELIVIDGAPVEFNGTMTKKEGGVNSEDMSGTYTSSYSISPLKTQDEDATLQRDINFDVKWRRDGKQIIKDYTLKNWSETISGGAGEYTLDPDQSHFSISIIEDHTPGVTYYKGTSSMVAVYTDGGDGEISSKVESTSSIYGYSSAWSSTEVQRIDTWVYNDGWQAQYQIRPSVSVSKTTQYSENEPTAISFAGNYQDIIHNQSGLSYDILVKPNIFYNIPNNGSISVPSYNTHEQLIAPDTSFLKGHFAEYDINKLFSMKVFEGNPKFFKPEQAMTRGEYVEALTKAIKLEIKSENLKQPRKKDPIRITFPDVLPERAGYPYIMAAYEAGLAIGRDDGNFHTDYPIERQEAIVILIRALGLEQLGLNPSTITPFVDDGKIASWAKREINAAYTLGIISGDGDGNFRPTDNVSKAEGAALINRLIDYMREDLVIDYTEHIMNYTY